MPRASPGSQIWDTTDLLRSVRGGTIDGAASTHLQGLQISVTRQLGAASRPQGHSVWDMVIHGAAGADKAASVEADPRHTTAEVVWADGSRVWRDAALNSWKTSPSSAQEQGQNPVLSTYRLVWCQG